ncbi:branched-chain amino acid ABC transporter substrate-binding protein [Ideonella sp. DXS22W]|uniref:Branched-chain amino acid ABC transporter substrate-binding protein n=1 Tax=Pseudaquabacterium inlustre TaxID=2984192 RepID=A0ABU9CPC2_9BURK
MCSKPGALRRLSLAAAAALSTALSATVLPAAAQNTASAPSAEPVRLALIEALSGPFANAGEAVFRNLLWATERVNARGGVKLPGGARKLELVRMDSKGQADEALTLLKNATDKQIGFVLQGNSSSVASALIDALNKHNEREPQRRAVLLNYSAVEPSLTNERCSFWHFRFDAHADMRLNALMSVLQDDKALKKVYLIGQDYSFGQNLAKQARAQIQARRPDIEIVGDELHPMGRVKDFMPYATKIRASGAQAVVTGNWGNDLTLLVKATRELGVPLKYYTFYGNALGAPAALGDAGVGAVLAVAEWQPNLGDAPSEALVSAFHKRFPDPRDDYLHARMQALVELLAQAMEKARSTDPAAVARALEGLSLDAGALGGVHQGTMRAADHQFQQPLVVSLMDKAGTPGVRHDVEGSGYGFRTVRRFDARALELPHTCRMTRPE